MMVGQADIGDTAREIELREDTPRSSRRCRRCWSCSSSWVLRRRTICGPSPAGPIPAYLHVHGAAMTIWFLLLLVQTALIATRRRGSASPTRSRWRCGGGGHRGVEPARRCAERSASDRGRRLHPTDGPDRRRRSAPRGNLSGAGRHWRSAGGRYPETHSRMLLLASLAVSGPALGRLSLNLIGTPFPGVIALMSLPLLVVVSRSRVDEAGAPCERVGGRSDYRQHGDQYRDRQHRGRRRDRSVVPVMRRCR